MLADAKNLGLQTCNGLPMLIGQAVFAEEIWQSRKIDMAMLDPLFAAMNESFSFESPSLTRNHKPLTENRMKGDCPSCP